MKMFWSLAFFEKIEPFIFIAGLLLSFLCLFYLPENANLIWFEYKHSFWLKSRISPRRMWSPFQRLRQILSPPEEMRPTLVGLVALKCERDKVKLKHRNIFAEDFLIHSLSDQGFLLNPCILSLLCLRLSIFFKENQKCCTSMRDLINHALLMR